MYANINRRTIKGKPLVQLCYKHEGDDEFLCCSTYDDWIAAQNFLSTLVTAESAQHLRRLMPKVTELVDSVNNPLFDATDDPVADAVKRDNYIKYAARIAAKACTKMSEDFAPHGRLYETMSILRACRLFDYKFVARISLESIQVEVVCLQALQIGVFFGEAAIMAEVFEYKRLADETYGHADRISISEFWARQELSAIPSWYRISRDILLVVPSSATVERVFSILTQGFSPSQQNALQDYQFASTMLKYNRLFPLPA